MSRRSNTASSKSHNVETSKHSAIEKLRRCNAQTQRRWRVTTPKRPNTAPPGSCDAATPRGPERQQLELRNVPESHSFHVQKAKLRDAPTPGASRAFSPSLWRAALAVNAGRRSAAAPQHPDPPMSGTRSAGVLHRPEGSAEKPSQCDLAPPEPNAVGPIR